VAWTEEDSDNLRRLTNVFAPRPTPESGGGRATVGGAIGGAVVVAFLISLPIGIVMWLAGLPPVYENLVFWPLLFLFCFLFWPKK
jgi:hypothetical protein